MYSTHASLLARIAHEDVDPQAWIEFHDRYAPVILGFARRRGLQGTDCEDIVQDVLLALTRAMPGFEYRPERGRFRSYLKTITVRLILRRSRQKRPAVPLGSVAEPDDPSVEADWDVEWRQYHVRLAMTRLEAEFNERDRMAFAQYAMAGRPPAAVADELGMSVDLVYRAKSRILKRLSALIAEQVEDEG